MFVQQRTFNCSYYGLRPLLYLQSDLYKKAVLNTYCFVDQTTKVLSYPKSVYLLLDKAKINTEILQKQSDDSTDFEVDYIDQMLLPYYYTHGIYDELVDWYENDTNLLLVAKLQECFFDDYLLFFEGKYSHYSEQAKKKALQTEPKAMELNGKFYRNSYWSLFYPGESERRIVEQIFETKLETVPETMHIPIKSQETLHVEF